MTNILNIDPVDQFQIYNIKMTIDSNALMITLFLMNITSLEKNKIGQFGKLIIVVYLRFVHLLFGILNLLAFLRLSGKKVIPFS